MFGLVDTSPEKFEIFTLKNTSYVFRLHFAEEFENTTMTGHFKFGNLGQGSHIISVMLSFRKAPFSKRFQNVFKTFSVHTKNEKPAFSNSSGLKSIKLRFSLRQPMQLQSNIRSLSNGRSHMQALHF